MYFPSLFEEDFFDDLFNWAQPYRHKYVGAIFPKLNIYEDESNYYITAEIPGIDKKDLKINVKGNVLTIEGERKGINDENLDYYRIGRTYGSFKRSISLSEHVDTSKIDAQLKNGVLLIILAKSEEQKPKQIEVK